MRILLLLLLSWGAKAEQLTVQSVDVLAPAKAASCGLLRQREKERLKLLRELAHLAAKEGALGQGAPPASSYEYWWKKHFMPSEDWAEISSEVLIRVQVPEGLQVQHASGGLSSVFLITRGPGFIWHSFANQLPPEMSIEPSGGTWLIRYRTYLTAVCSPDWELPTVEWLPDPGVLVH